MKLIVTSKNQISTEMKRLKLWELLLYLLESHSEVFLAFLNRGVMPHNETTIRKVVESNITENLSLEEMAFLCNVSTSTFKRQFGKIYNTSPTLWFAEQKMKLAAKYLTDYREKPGEVWFKLGYETHTSFTKSFKKYLVCLLKHTCKKPELPGTVFDPGGLTMFCAMTAPLLQNYNHECRTKQSNCCTFQQRVY
jgi:AraC-like DNA-binding protein